jgi:threonine dehydrogenase-like Zn-dependent dehydrogenase
MSRHESRQRLAREFGATEIVEERGDEGVARIKELTNGLGAHSVVEAVGTQESMLQAIQATLPGGHVGFVGVAHDVALPAMDLFWSLAQLHGGPAPVRRFLPQLIDLIWNRQIDPRKVFDLELRSPMPQRATRRWTNGVRSRRSCAPDLGEHPVDAVARRRTGPGHHDLPELWVSGELLATLPRRGR